MPLHPLASTRKMVLRSAAEVSDLTTLGYIRSIFGAKLRTLNA